MDISALPKEIWLSKLKTADVLVFGGGNTFHLMYWFKKSGLRRLLTKLLKTKVYVGISAGSMVATPSISLSQSNKLYAESYEKCELEKALELVHFEIRPHLNNPYFPKVTLKNLSKLAKTYKKTFYAIDDNSAIKVNGKIIKVISEGTWKRFN